MKAEKLCKDTTNPLRPIIACTAAALVLLACMGTFRSGFSGDINVQKEGLIGADVLQISLIVAPDAHIKGLVARRENARNKIENNFTDLLGKKIAEYCQANIASCKTAKEEILLTHAKNLMEHAFKAAEYYKEDESYVVIVRISQKNIREILECPKPVGEKSSNENVRGKR